MIDAAEAYAKRIVSRVVAVNQFEEELSATLARIVAGAPLSARWHKKFVRRLTVGLPLTDTELEEGYACFDTEDFAEGYRSFLAKRRPEFTGT